MQSGYAGTSSACEANSSFAHVVRGNGFPTLKEKISSGMWSSTRPKKNPWPPEEWWSSDWPKRAKGDGYSGRTDLGGAFEAADSEPTTSRQRAACHCSGQPTSDLCSRCRVEEVDRQEVAQQAVHEDLAPRLSQARSRGLEVKRE